MNELRGELIGQAIATLINAGVDLRIRAVVTRPDDHTGTVRENWKETAEGYARSAAYWRERAEAAEAANAHGTVTTASVQSPAAVAISVSPLADEPQDEGNDEDEEALLDEVRAAVRADDETPAARTPADAPPAVSGPPVPVAPVAHRVRRPVGASAPVAVVPTPPTVVAIPTPPTLPAAPAAMADLVATAEADAGIAPDATLPAAMDDQHADDALDAALAQPSPGQEVLPLGMPVPQSAVPLSPVPVPQPAPAPILAACGQLDPYEKAEACQRPAGHPGSHRVGNVAW